MSLLALPFLPTHHHHSNTRQFFNTQKLCRPIASHCSYKSISMGRALFSLAYTVPKPVVRTEPEPQVETCSKWSEWNRFDPDSDDFFQDAEYEAFIDHIPERLIRSLASPGGATDNMDLENRSDASNVSPMAVGNWDTGFHIAGLGLIDRPSTPSDFSSSSSLSPVHSPVSPQDADLLDNPPFIPPLSFRGPSPGIELPESPTFDPQSAIPITVSRIQILPATRSPSPDLPSTPAYQTNRARQTSQTMLTPSPPPSVSPRVYSWQHHPIPALPASPTGTRGNNRMPLPRLETAPTRILISNSVM